MPDRIADIVSICLLAGAFVWLTLRIKRAGRTPRPVIRDQDLEETRECENCGYDLRAGHDRCPDCGAPVITADSELARESVLDAHALRDNWPTAVIKPRRPEDSESRVIVHTTPNEFEANLLIEQLTSRGVLAGRTTKEEFRHVGGYSWTVHLIQVIVPSGDEELARAIIEGFRRKPVESSG